MRLRAAEDRVIREFLECGGGRCWSTRTSASAAASWPPMPGGTNCCIKSQNWVDMSFRHVLHCMHPTGNRVLVEPARVFCWSEWRKSIPNPGLDRCSAKSLTSKTPLSAFCCPQPDRTPGDTKGLHGPRGRKHRHLYTRGAPIQPIYRGLEQAHGASGETNPYAI